MDIQQLLNQNSGAFVELPAGEYKGNFVINHPCRVIGNHTTFIVSEREAVQQLLQYCDYRKFESGNIERTRYCHSYEL